MDKSCLEWTISYKIYFYRYKYKIFVQTWQYRAGVSSCSVNFEFIDFYQTKRVSWFDLITEDLNIGSQRANLIRSANTDFCDLICYLVFSVIPVSTLWLKPTIIPPDWFGLIKIDWRGLACVVFCITWDTWHSLCSADLCGAKSVSVISVNKTEPYWSYGGQDGHPLRHHSTTSPLPPSSSHIIVGLTLPLSSLRQSPPQFILSCIPSLVFLFDAWCFSLTYLYLYTTLY